MKITRQIGVAISTLTVIAILGARAADVTIDPTVRHQRIEGWGVSSTKTAKHILTLAPTPLLHQIYDDAVFDLGLTRFRLGPDHYSELFERLNDDGNPDSINWSGFNTSQLDLQSSRKLVPLKQRVQSRGEKFSLYLSMGFTSSSFVPNWVTNSPGEYTENAIAFLEHMKNVYGLDVEHIVVQNEPLNGSSQATPQLHARIIKTMGPKLQQLGYPAKIQFADGMTPQDTWTFIQALQGDPDVWPHVGLLSYHLYPAMDPERSLIRDFGLARGIPTAQTENMNSTLDTLYADLTLGGVSFWEESFGFMNWGESAGQGAFFVSKNLASYFRHVDYWRYYQIMHYVRPGSVRINATSSVAGLRTLAFDNSGKMTVVLINTSSLGNQSVDVRGLPAGNYGISQSVSRAAVQTMGVKAVNSGATLTVNVPNNAVLTIYPHSVNLAPLITSQLGNPGHLYSPASSTTLSSSAVDPEGAAISYAWSVMDQPVGAAASIATPTAATTTVSGLSIPGMYVFKITASDGSLTTSRQVIVNVFSGNQAPYVFDVHHRIPSIVIAPTSSTTLRAAANDLENDALNLEWKIISQPVGASATLATPTAGSCVANNLTIPGDYVFRFEARDPSHVVFKDLTVTVHPTNPNPAVISSISANPSSLNSPASSTLLSAVTSDPDGDAISHWWEETVQPVGAKAVFGTPGQRTTTVSGLTVAGTYTFKLTALDRTLVTTKTVDVVVGTGLPTITVTATDATGSETGPDNGVFTFTRNGPTTAALTVIFSVGGTAASGSDYTPIGTSVTFPAGAATVTKTLTPIDDSAVESNETVVLTLAADPAYAVGTPSSATVTIADNDVALSSVSITATDASASETGPDSGLFTFTRTGPTAAALTVNFTVSGSAASGSDYTSIGTSVTFAAGSATAVKTVAPINDSAVESSETVTVTIVANSAYAIGAASSATVSIADNDVPPNTPPSIDSTTATPNPAQVNQTVAFSAAASDVDGDALSYLWDFGDGSTAVGANATHSFTTSGTYTVTLAVNDGQGGAVQKTLSLSVYALPTNLLIDAGFENNGQNWQKIAYGGRSIVGSPTHTGARAQQIITSSVFEREVYQDVLVTPGEAYNAAGWIKTSDFGGSGARIELIWLNASGAVGCAPCHSKASHRPRRNTYRNQ